MNYRESEGWSRREFLGGMALTGAGAMLGVAPKLSLAAPEPPPETTTLRLRVWRPSCWSPVHVAESLLKEEGFTDIQYLSGPGPKAVEMFQKGTVDLSPTFSATEVYAMETHNHPAVFLSGLHVGCYALVGSDKVNSVRDLKGKTVWTGTVEDNGPHIFFKAIVAYVGLDPYKDVNYVWVKKDEAIQQFKDGKFPLLIATDVASRGLDIDDITHVVNYDLPDSAEDYVHRVGRTARMGKEGAAVTFITADDGPMLTAIEKLINKQIRQEIFPGFEISKPVEEEKKAAKPDRPPGLPPWANVARRRK